MDLGWVVVILVGGLLVGLISGIPVALVLLSTGIAAFVVGEGLDGLRFLASLPWGKSFSFALASIPLYVLMGYMLQESGARQGPCSGCSRTGPGSFRALSGWSCC